MSRAKVKIEFVGGPLDGTVDRVKCSDLTPYAAAVIGRREYCYRFRFMHTGGTGMGIKVKRRWVFMGHRATVPKE